MKCTFSGCKREDAVNVLGTKKNATRALCPAHWNILAVEIDMGKGPGLPTGGLGEAHGHFDRHDYADFIGFVRKVLDQSAADKSYSTGGPDGDNPLFEFTNSHFPGHAFGEVVYKLVRYQRKGNPEDLFKAVAWIYLAWREKHGGF